MTAKIPDDVAMDAANAALDCQRNGGSDKDAILAAGEVFVAWERERMLALVEELKALSRQAYENPDSPSVQEAIYNKSAADIYEGFARSLRARSAPEKG